MPQKSPKGRKRGKAPQNSENSERIPTQEKSEIKINSGIGNFVKRRKFAL